ncbi:cytochrome [Sinomonas sp. ASV322]|uniref:cytochrome n=1 Tax=Sinomonas sp. ASV322 TaxID=3041920 RepID=UPI0027DB22D7|nr:cytochrome [Sinomonas sp. ASV322]MDQ4500907.1 cytochrome [Sinomonas sp. ASV322]
MTVPGLAAESPDGFGRMYRRSLSDEPTVPSITTVIAQQPLDLDGWRSYMAARHIADHPELREALDSPARIRQLVRTAVDASHEYARSAAQRGDRVHGFAEQLALQALGRANRLDEAREELSRNGEEGFGASVESWWESFGVEPIAPEQTVWNTSVGYAGTLDLVARINGRVCLVDYKTKGTTRDGRVKPPDDKVAMQLVAGMKAEESLVDASAGEWEAWQYGEDPLLIAVAIGETEYAAVRVNPDVRKFHWATFCRLRRVWAARVEAAAAGRTLLPLPPPPGTPSQPAD